MKILLFARARDLAGTDTIEVDLLPNSRVVELRQALVRSHPELAGLVGHSAIAIGGEYADDATQIGMDVEIALIPPISGG